MVTTAPGDPRPIRSFVRRMGRITAAQERALVELWPRFGIGDAGIATTDAPDATALEDGLLDLDRVFGRRRPRVIEIGFGNGENLVELASAHPERDYLGLEVHLPGVGRVLLEADRIGLTNLRIACRDAVEVLERRIPERSLAEVLVLFPDPWHKQRHHKRRLIQPPFAALLASRLEPGGVLHLATDWQPYAEQMLEVLTACAELENLAPGSAFAPRPPWRPPTRFERRGARLGHGVWDLEFRRREAS
jgi:tRNA (guanine-N7-)-methyltransferase